MITPLAARRGLITPLGRGIQRESAAVSWWLSGGISAANCLAAYQPKGAADYAATLSNLNNPGTNNASSGAAPDWDGTNGWKFNGSTHYISTVAIRTGDTHTTIIRWSNSDGTEAQHLMGSRTSSSASTYFYNANFYGTANFVNSNKSLTPAEVTSGVFCMAGLVGYVDGVAKGTIAAPSTTGDTPVLFVGASNDGGGAVYNAISAYIQAVAIYSTKLDATQVALVSAAMAAL